MEPRGRLSPLLPLLLLLLQPLLSHAPSPDVVRLHLREVHPVPSLRLPSHLQGGARPIASTS
jgi:hypothetical protein